MPRKPSSRSSVLTLKEIVAAAGGHCPLAAHLKITPSAIHQWDVVPIDRAIEVARMTGIPVGRIRPDIWSHEALREAAGAHLTKMAA